MKSDQLEGGPLEPKRPYRVYKRAQERISRRNLYQTTTLYTLSSVILFILAFRWNHPYRALAFYLGGIPFWMFVEYFSHRYILHRHFKVSKKWYKKFFTGLANKYLDPLHFGHHERPFDGNHMSGELRDLLPLFVVGLAVSFIFPSFTAAMVLAGAFQSYVAEEWIHHSTHYYNLRDPYFRYMKKHHFYHHTSHGMTMGFGTSSGILDAIFKTRYPENVRQRLYGTRQPPATAQTEQPIQQA